MTRRLLFSYLSLTALVLVVLEVPLGVTFASSERRQLTEAVRHDAFALVLLSEETVEGRTPGNLDGLVASYRRRTGGRATIVDARGARLADSAPSEGESFANRPEIQTALAGREAVGVRYSRTLGQRLLYVAEPVASAGQVRGAVRITYPATFVERRIRRTWLLLAGTGAVALAAVLLVSLWLARSLTRPLRELEAAASRLGRGGLATRASVPPTPREARSLALSFNEMAAQLQRLVGGQQRFVADASHQLRTPLAALRLRLENLGPELPPSAKEDLDGAVAESGRLSRLVDGLLTLAHAEGTGSPPQPVDLAEVMAERLAAWSPLAEERSVRLEGDLPRPIPVWSAPDRLDQVLDNLLANALEVAPPASRITLTGGRSGDLVELHVVDQGPGLSPEDRERALDRFWRGATSRADHGGGFGLGLAIVRQLLATDGGSIELRSAPSTGLDVVVWLRAVTPESVS
jgi:signal transduction histidine kinase